MKGFTLIELMISVAIIAVLSAIAIPKFAESIRRSHEAVTRGNLAAIRVGIGMYFADIGKFPTDNLQSLVTSGYLKEIPMRYVPTYHPDDHDVTSGGWNVMVHAHGAWFYNSDPNSTDFGTVIVNCVHQDLRGNVWSTN